MSSVTVAFTGWNSVQSSWNTSTWNTSLPFSLTATGAVGSATITGNANVSVTGVAGTSALGNLFTTNMGVTSTGAVGSATITGNANVSVTGVAGTTTLGSFFTTNTMVTMTASVNSASTAVTGNANVTVTGVSATGEIGILQQPWGLIIPSQTPNFSGITPTQSPSWADVAAQDKKMASTYVNDLRLEEIGSGEQSGSWGDTTNTNLELIAEAFSFGTEAITTNADTHTTTIADGATDPGRSLFLKYTGTLDSACTITLAPNTISKLWFIENGTSGSQNIIIKQGSGATITVPPGDTKAIYSDGAGSGGKMVDAFASLSVVDLKVQDDLTVTDDVAIGGLATVGGTLGVTGVLTATAGAIFNGGITTTGVLLGGVAKILFRDSGLFINSSTDGQLDIDADTELELTAPTIQLVASTKVDLDGNLDVSGTALVTGVLTTTAATVFNGGFVSNANSGIGLAASTGVRLEVKTTEADHLVARFENSHATGSYGISVKAGDDTGNYAADFANKSGTSLMRIRGDGNIGIGTDSPTQKLRVEGNIQSTGQFYAGSTGVGTPDYAFAADTSLGMFRLPGALGFATGGTQRMQITSTGGLSLTPANGGHAIFNESDGNVDFRVESLNNTHMLYVDGGNDKVSIGSNAPLARLDVMGQGTSASNLSMVIGADEGNTANPTRTNNTDKANRIGLPHYANGEEPMAMFVCSATNGVNNINIGGGTSVMNAATQILFSTAANSTTTTGTERGRFDSSGNFLVGETAASSITNGTGAYLAVNGQFYASSTSSHFFNKQADGDILFFRSAGNSEGVISISGSTTTYTGFSGRHESSGIPANTPVGTVVSTIDALDVYPDTQLNPQTEKPEACPKAGQTRADHAKVEVSTSEGDVCVYGVVAEFTSQDKLIVTSVGIGSVRVTGACSKGDLLESKGDGTAKVQSDDVVRSKTLGKVTIGNSNTGVKLVSCVLYCG